MSFTTRDGLVMPFSPSKLKGLDSTSEDGLSEALGLLSLFFVRVQLHDGLDIPAAPRRDRDEAKLPSSFQKREWSTSPRGLRGVNLTRSSVLNWYRRRHCRWESTLPISLDPLASVPRRRLRRQLGLALSRTGSGEVRR